MAKLKGIIKIQGSMAGITFFQKNGNSFTKETTGVSKQKIATDPNFRRTRENNQEFAGAAMAGKALRSGLQSYLKGMSDARVSSTLMKVFRQMINMAETGERGQRSIEVFNNKDLLVGFDFNSSTEFNSVFLAPFSVEVNADRTAATFSIPDFSTDNSLRVPPGATHFRILSAVSVLSSYEFNESSKKYVPEDAKSNTQYATAVGNYIPVGGYVGAVTELKPEITPPPALLETSVLVACIGVEFYQRAVGKYYLLAQSNCMKIANAF